MYKVGCWDLVVVVSFLILKILHVRKKKEKISVSLYYYIIDLLSVYLHGFMTAVVKYIPFYILIFPLNFTLWHYFENLPERKIISSSFPYFWVVALSDLMQAIFASEENEGQKISVQTLLLMVF